VKKTLALLLLAAATAGAQAGEPVQAISQCTVSVTDPADPTLNAHTRPHGPIVAVFENGETVNTYDRQGDWIFVEGALTHVNPQDPETNTFKQGWVFGAYLRGCHEAAG
jgi:hypothetical protein